MSLYVYQCDQCGDITPTVVLRGPHDHVPLCRHSGGDFPMTRVDSRPVVLPLDPPASIGPASVATLKAAGILTPSTQDALDWLWRHRATNGMAGAFLKVGGRRCIDLVAFAKLMRERKA